MYEELMTEEESLHAYETDDMFIISNSFVKSTASYVNARKAEQQSYSSHGALPISKESLKKLLHDENLLLSKN
ncbi:hypothetical protein D3C80_1855960 [compost metagenome]